MPLAGAGCGAVLSDGALVGAVLPPVPELPEEVRRTAAASSRIVFGCSVEAFEPKYASSRLLIMKTAAKIAVARDSAVLAPRAPNTVPEAPAPKPAPASAPLPRWISTRKMIATQEIT